MNIWEEKRAGGALDDYKFEFCGKRIRNMGHAFGPYDRKNFLIYYIKEGKARLTHGGGERTLSGGCVFVNFPMSGCVYRTLDGEPWSIKWFSATAPMLAESLARVGLTPASPVLPVRDGAEIEAVFDEMYESFDSPTLASRFLCVSLLHRFLALLAEGCEPRARDARIEEADRLIAAHFGEADFGVCRLAAMLGLHHNYFSVLYKREAGISPIAAIREQRLRAAGKMLRFTDRTVKEVAFAVGFADELYFSRAFRSHYGMSPTEFRRAEAYPI